MNAVLCENISFAYGDAAPVLNNVSLTIAQGEICGIVGASGSGKSTLLRILAGLLPASPSHRLSGVVRIGNLTANEARDAGVFGFVFQDLKLLPHLTVGDNLRWAEKSIEQRGSQGIGIERALTLVGLDNFAHAALNQLSGGMKARLAIARALLGEPEILLLDEAFGALDVGWRLHLHRELGHLRDTLGLAIVMISHDLDEISSLADRVAVLSARGTIAGIVGQDIPRIERVSQMSDLILFDHPARDGRS